MSSSSARKKRARAVEQEITSFRQRKHELREQVREYRNVELQLLGQVAHRSGRVEELRPQVEELCTCGQVQELRGQTLPSARDQNCIAAANERIQVINKHIEEIKEEIAQKKEEIKATSKRIEEIKKDIEALDVEAIKAEEEFAVLRLSVQATTSDDYFEKVQKLGPPSSLSRGDNWRKPQDSLMYLCHIPPEAEPPFPLTLTHPAFANFVDRFNTSTIEFGSEECELVRALCHLVVQNENEMMYAFNALLGKYLQQTILPVMVINYPTDGSLVYENHMVYQSQGKINEGNPLFQAIHYYGLFLSMMERHKTESTFCPCFLVELVGFDIRISGLAFFEKVACQPFTPFLHCYFNSYDKTDMDSLCRAMLALKRGISELLQYYSPHPNPPPVDKTIPYSLWEKQVQCVKRIGTKLLFLVKMGQSEELRLFKFCKRYGEEVHKLWAANGLAPKLFNCQRIAGGWFAVEMEYLGHDWKSVYQWCNDVQSVDKSGLRQAIQNALERAHKLKCEGKEVAHGDMRAPNIMAKSVEGTFVIKFVDFDWAGEVSSTSYPSFISKEEKWHEGVGPGKPLSQDHDKWWEDKWIQGGTTT